MNKIVAIITGIGEFLKLLWKTINSIKYFGSTLDKFLAQLFEM